MTPTRISTRRTVRRVSRTTFASKAVSLPTFSCYGHEPVVYFDGELIVGFRIIPLHGARS